MNRTRLLCVIATVFWAAGAYGRQATPPPVELSEALRAHLKNDRFAIVTSVRGLPLGVRNSWQMLFGSTTLDIAEPGENFGINDLNGDSRLPPRRMVVAGCSTDHCLVYYERGGADHTWRVLLFHWRPDTTRIEWGGLAPRGLTSIDEVRKAVLGGEIKEPATRW
ncbi:MAG: hypothetical protein HOP16_20895 [Acidobacteria bacterium]|nr:hypothetical protein [Acidobacteriota bacterium]